MNKLIHPFEPEELMAYLDGELSRERMAVAAAHLSHCAECREEVAGLRGVPKALTAWAVESIDPHTPPALATALDGNMNQGRQIAVAMPAWRTTLRRSWRPAAWIGAFAAIALVAYIGSDFRFAKKSPFIEADRVALVPDSQSSQKDYVYSPDASSRPAAAPAVSTGLVSQKAELAQNIAPPPPRAGETNVPAASGPMIIRTADLSLIVKDFDNTRSAVEVILKRHRGYVGELKVGGSTGSGRSLTATLRVPADQLDITMNDLKALGRVQSESQSGQDVTSQYVDLQARLANARNTEQRLTDLLRNRTGKLSDVLEVEQEVDRVRGDIEQMEAERKTMSTQVSFATLNVTVVEDYKAQLQVVPPSTSTRLSNAAVEGYKSMVEGIVGLALYLLENIPTVLFWAALLFLPARFVWKRVRRSFAQ